MKGVLTTLSMCCIRLVGFFFPAAECRMVESYFRIFLQRFEKVTWVAIGRNRSTLVVSFF